VAPRRADRRRGDHDEDVLKSDDSANPRLSPVLPRRSVAAAVVLAGSAASAACAPPPRSPAQGGPAWLEVTTERFVLRTDLDEAAARAAARDFETAYGYLEQVAFPGPARPSRRLDVVLFRDDREFHYFWPRDMRGFYMDRPPQDLERAPTMALYGDLRGDARVVFLHELTHRFIARAYGWAPPWMQEGLAEYFSTMRVEGSRAVLGFVPDGALVQPYLVPAVQELIAADRAAFYGVWTGQDDDGLHRARYYAGAYALVHLLRNGPDRLRRRFDVFVDAMSDGARPADAWARAFGDIPADAFESAFRSHLAAWRRWDLFAARVEALPRALAERVRTMTDDEVHVLWARMLRADGDDAAKVREQLAEALARAPASPHVAYARGCFELAQRHVSGARALFEAALAREPDDPRYLYAVLRARVTEGEHPEAAVELLDRLARFATSADELGVVALYESSRGDRDAATRHAEQAVEADPGYAGALATRARVRFEAGDVAGAVADQEHALALLPEHADGRPFVRALDGYRRALAGRGAPK